MYKHINNSKAVVKTGNFALISSLIVLFFEIFVQTYFTTNNYSLYLQKINLILKLRVVVAVSNLADLIVNLFPTLAVNI